MSDEFTGCDDGDNDALFGFGMVRVLPIGLTDEGLLQSENWK